jgi:N-methylhydantoinase A
VIEEFGSTLPVHPGFTGRVDAYGNVIVTAAAVGPPAAPAARAAGTAGSEETAGRTS